MECKAHLKNILTCMHVHLIIMGLGLSEGECSVGNGSNFRVRRDGGSLVVTGTHLPCGYMKHLRVCLSVLCNSEEWHPCPQGSLKVTYQLWSHPLCSKSTRDVGSLVSTGTHLPCGYMEQSLLPQLVHCSGSAHDLESLAGTGRYS